MTGGLGAIVWLIIAVVLCVIEGATIQLVCVWFACGSLFAMLASFIGAPVWLQMLIFLVSSIAVLIVGRPILLEKIKPKREATNADRVVGQVGLVLEEIDNLRQTGRVSANGLDWSARSEGGERIPEGTQVVVRRIEGVKLIVWPLPDIQEEKEEEE